MSEFHATRNRLPDETPWRREGARTPQQHRGNRASTLNRRNSPPKRPGSTGERQLRPTAASSSGPLTALGVTIVLGGACVTGAVLDLLLVHTAAWAITGLFLAASCYSAAKVRRADWYSAVVGPPLAYALGLTVVAVFSSAAIGSGFLGTAATMLELLALKARAVFLGTGLALAVTLARRLPFRR